MDLPTSETLVTTKTYVIFEAAVPYRVSQILGNRKILLRECNDNFDPKAPKVLAVVETATEFTSSKHSYKTLTICDKILVTKYEVLSECESNDSIVMGRARDRLLYIKHWAIALLVEVEASLLQCEDVSHICEVQKSGAIKIPCRKTYNPIHVAPEIAKSIPEGYRKIGKPVKCQYVKVPEGSYVNSYYGMVILPSVLIHCGPILIGNGIRTTEEEKEVLFKVSMIEFLKTWKEVSDASIGLYALLFSNFIKDKGEAIGKTTFKWKISNSGYADVIYKNLDKYFCKPNYGNLKNSLFSKGAVAILKRFSRGRESEEIFVKIIKAVFKEKKIKIVFKVHVPSLLDEWRLNSVNDLTSASAEYSLFPTDIIAHWRPFVEKLNADEDYLETISTNSLHPILRAFLPNGTNNMQINQLPDSDFDEKEETIFQHASAQENILREIATGKPIVVIDGAAQTGKTCLNTQIIPNILDSIINLQAVGSFKCLALVSPVRTLNALLDSLSLYNKDGIRILNLIYLDDQTSRDTFCDVMNKTAVECNLTDEDKAKLKAGKELLKSKFWASFHEIKQFERNISNYNLTKEELARKESIETYVDVVTSKELKIFQNAMEVIFRCYRPNFVIASTETFITYLPAMSTSISHLVVDEAGRMPYIEGLNMVAELPNLEQLVLNGDMTAYPY